MDPLTYLEEHCMLRHNILTGETLYSHDGEHYEVLSPEAVNTLILEAGREGVTLDETTIARYCQQNGMTCSFPSDDEVLLDGKPYEIYRGYETGSRGNYGVKCREK